MSQILIAHKDQHAAAIRELFSEYLVWATNQINQEFGLGFVANDYIEQDMASLEKFMPPKGRLLLAFDKSAPVGVACLKELDRKTGEVKRMYVKPEQRGQGIGKALLTRLIDEAIPSGYNCLRLDSARFMTDAHRLYHSMGFAGIEPYEGSEIPKEFQSHWVFMEKRLG